MMSIGVDDRELSDGSKYGVQMLVCCSRSWAFLFTMLVDMGTVSRRS